MGKTPFFSIVMPVYGVEAYLEDCVASLLAQTDEDFELILVDDCAKDRSGQICDQLAQTDARIRVIHLPENGGLSNARNQGFTQVQGEYVLFLDSDDQFAPDLLSNARAAIEKNPAQVTVYGLVEEFFNQKGELVGKNRVGVDRDYFLTDLEQLRKFVITLEQKTLYGYAWNKVYQTSYLRSIGAQFKKITLIEDIEFNVSVFQGINRLNVLSATPYRYKKRNNTSLTNRFVPEYFSLHRQRVKLVLDQYESWGLCDQSVKEVLSQIYTRYIISALQRNCDPHAHMTGQERRQWLRNLYQDELWQTLSPYLPSSHSVLGMMGKLLRSKRTGCVLAAGRAIYWIRASLPTLFSQLKKTKSS